jgi:L-aminopeptidase/D-esterase-like protein
MKGGVGTSCVKGSNGVVVGALAVVNAFGDVLDPDSNEILAGSRISKKSLRLANSSQWIIKGVTRKPFGAPTRGDDTAYNTTLGVIATNAKLSKKEISQAVQIAHCGFAKVISPLHTAADGDLVFGLSLGNKKADVNAVGLLGEAALIESVKRAVVLADGYGIIPAFKDRTRKE